MTLYVKIKSMGTSRRRVAFRLALVAGLSLSLVCLVGSLRAREKPPQLAQIEVETGREGCAAEIDSTPVGKTDASGRLLIEGVEPGDHYLHLKCQDEAGKAYFVSPQADEKILVRHGGEVGGSGNTAPPALEPAEIKLQLRRHIREAVELRARGRTEEAVKHLRSAFQLDPDNSDLHRELGITFLDAKEWKRARVEMLEAIRHDPTDAEAHNGLGYALEKIGDLQGALAAYQTASKLEPGDPAYRRRYIATLARISEIQATKKKRKSSE
ncbi:MAG: tetratricopeptide repeat protein [Terriglobia bacterium]